jgi:thiol-disulfide isomerase/thioredoxin
VLQSTFVPVRLTLITRHDCHLCEEMAAVIDEVAPRFGAQVEVRDVDADRELLALYTDEVPVLLIDDRKAFKYRVTASELERRLRAAARARST